MKRFWWKLGIGGLVALAACDQSVAPPTTGSITIRLLVPPATSAVSPSPAASPGVPDGNNGDAVAHPGRLERDGDESFSAEPQNAAQAPESVTLESIRVSVSAGPTPKTQTFQCTATLCEGTVEGLDPGTYTVGVEGLISSQVTYYGKTTGVGVTAGNNSTASVSFSNFQPTLNDFTVTSTTALTLTVSYAAVSNADSYIIEWSKTSDFATSSNTSATGTSTTITVSDVGTYYVRVRAVNPAVPSGGRPSDPKTITVTLDQTNSGDDGTTAPLLSSTWNYAGTLTKLNVFPQADQDWFKVQACTNDVVTAETFAARLTPASGLNTFLRFKNASGTDLATNDNISGSTDSKVQQTITADGAYYVQVTGVSNTVGQYEVNITVQAGAKNAGSKCTTTKQVVVSAPQDTLVALGDSMQLTATALDTTGAPVAGAAFTWGSSNSAILSVSQTGWVKAVTNGDAIITATESGTPGQRTIAVAQGVATVTLSPNTASIAAGATQQFTATAYDALSNAVTGVAFFWASNNPSVAVVDTTGLATGMGAGTATITAVGRGQPGNAVVTVGAQIATQLVFSIQPGNSTAGDALSPAVQVEVRDASNNLVKASRDAVTVAIGTNPGSGSLAGTKTVNAVNGIASFSGLWIDKAGAGYTLGASSGSLSGATSSAFNITPGAPAKLGFSTQPANAQGNVVMGSVQVTIRDLYDNVVTADNTDQVTLSLASNPWKTPFSNGSVLSGTLVRTAAAGVATFNNLSIDKPAPGYTLAGASGTLTGATSSPFNINLTVSQVSAATDGSHTCAVTTGGSYCWGYNGNGQLGIPITSYQDSVAALVRTNQTFTQVTTGSSHSCGLTAAGAAYCWGYNGNGQLGNGVVNNPNYSDVPLLVTGGYTFTQIDAGSSHTCAVRADQRVLCWGYNGQGQVGNGTSGNNIGSPTLVDTTAAIKTFRSVSAGVLHTCAVRAGSDSTAYCWGYDYYGQLGDGAIIPGAAPKTVPTLVAAGFTNWIAVSAGYLHTCGVRGAPTNGRVYCWGYNAQGQLGDGVDFTTYSSPQQVTGSGAGLNIYVSVGAGSNHSCGVVQNGTGFCWGYNSNGELGDGLYPTNANAPSQVAGALTFASSGISTGSNHSCGRTTAPVVGVYCWGAGYNGQLGNGGTNGFQKVPVQIKQ